MRSANSCTFVLGVSLMLLTPFRLIVATEMTRIVTTTYRYKPPPKKRKAVAGPAIVRKATTAGIPSGGKTKPAPLPPANDDRQPSPPGARKPAIVTARRPGARRVDVPDLTPEEYQRRGDAADALWRELVRRATSKDRP
jgi:hypothetical protein